MNKNACQVFLVKKGHNSKNTTFIIRPLVWQLHLAMMSKFSKIGVYTFITFCMMTKNNNTNNDNLVNTTARHFFKKQTS